MMTYSGLWSRIRKARPACILVSGFSLATLKIWLLSFFRRTDYIIWSGSVEAPGWYDSTMRRWMRRRFVKRAVACIAYGTKAKDYLVKMGATPEQVFIAINTVDTEYFMIETQRLRRALQPDTAKHLLYVGYLEPRKNVMNLLLLMEKMAKQRQDVVLDIVGSGSEEASLRQYAAEHDLLDVVKFHGFRQKEELPAYFARASCFLFQTDFDIWGLVLNEAMAAGIPCLASHQAGASADLIRHGVNGYVLDFRQHDEVLKWLNILLDNPETAATVGRKAAETIREIATLKTSANGFMKALTI